MYVIFFISVHGHIERLSNSADSTPPPTPIYRAVHPLPAATVARLAHPVPSYNREPTTMYTVVEVHRDPSPEHSKSSSLVQQSASSLQHTRSASPQLQLDSSSDTVQSHSYSLPSQTSDRSNSMEDAGCSKRTSPQQVSIPSRATSTPSCQEHQTEQPRSSSVCSGSFVSYGESFDDLHQLTALREELKRKISETLSFSPIPSPTSLTPGTQSPGRPQIAPLQHSSPKLNPRPYASIYVNPLSVLDVCHSIESLDEPLRVSALEVPCSDSPTLDHGVTLDTMPWMGEEEPVYYNDYPGCTPPLEELQYATCKESGRDDMQRWQDLRESTV